MLVLKYDCFKYYLMMFVEVTEFVAFVKIFETASGNFGGF